MHRWKNSTTGEVVHREAHEKPEYERCWDGPELLTAHDGSTYYRFIGSDRYSPHVQRLGCMTRVDVGVTICVSKKLPVQMIFDPLYHTLMCIHRKLKEVYPDLEDFSDLKYRRAGDETDLTCNLEKLLNMDIIYVTMKIA